MITQSYLLATLPCQLATPHDDQGDKHMANFWSNGPEIEPELAKEILKACPNMKEIPWTYGAVVKFTQGGKYVTVQKRTDHRRKSVSLET